MSAFLKKLTCKGTWQQVFICLRCPGVVKQLCEVRNLQIHSDNSCVGNLSPPMGSRNQVGIGLSYRPATASLCSLATQFQTRFLESIPPPKAGLKFSTLYMLSTQHYSPPPRYTLYKYIPLYKFTQGGGKRSDPVRRLEGR
jgi:hypothetical protein